MQELKSALFEYVMHILKEKDTSPESLKALPDLIDKLI